MSETSLIEKAVDLAFEMPLTTIDRDEYLRQCFQTKYSPEMVEKIVKSNPLSAGVDKRMLQCIAEDSIAYERLQTTTTSAVAGLPGGFALVPASVADAAQILGHEIRLVQKIAYLYGYPNFNSGNGFDDKTKNVIICFLGVMYGTKGAAEVAKNVVRYLATNFVKDLCKSAITKTAWYPILKNICSKVFITMSKELLGKTLTKAIPFLSAGISGGITYYMFSQQSKKLHKFFMENPLK